MNYGKKHDLPFGIMDVAGLLRLNIRRRAPGQVYVDCPICGDRRGKMNLNTEKDLWRCNYCGEGGGIFARYNQAFPPDYCGRSIAPSDVLELYDESERRYFYCDMAGFPQVKFSPALAKKA